MRTDVDRPVFSAAEGQAPRPHGAPPGGSAPVCSILFAGPEHRPETAERPEPAVFRDLNLDQVVAVVTAGRGEYDLAPFFHSPLHDPDAITYRHEVLRDLDDQALLESIGSFARGMRAMREHLSQAAKLRHRYQKERWFLDAVRTYCDAVARLAERLGGLGLRSRGFLAFRDYLSGYVGSDAFAELVAETRQVVDELAAVRYCLHISGNQVTVTRYEDEADYSVQVAATFERFKQGAVKDYLVTFFESAEMNHVEAGVLDRVALLHPEAFSMSSWLDGTRSCRDLERGWGRAHRLVERGRALWVETGRGRPEARVNPDTLSLDDFERLVGEALASLPGWVQEAMADVALLVDDEPDPGSAPAGRLLLGQYHGVARTRRGSRPPGSLPDTITLYRVPIARVCHSRDEVAARVRLVLGHEIGHALGLGEARLRALGWC